MVHNKTFQKNLVKSVRCCFVLFSLCIWFACAPEEKTGVTAQARPVKIFHIKKPALTQTRAFPGVAREMRDVQLAFRVSGPLVALPVDIGQFVEQGALIARIDPRDFTVEVKSLNAKLAASRAQLTEAQLQYTRYKNLHRKKAVPKAEYDHAQAAYDMTAAQVETNIQALEAAQNALDDTALRAPFDGYVHHKFVENYDNVLAKQPIITFLDCSVVEVTAGIPEEMVADGIEFKGYGCSFDAYQGKRFPAQLKELGRKSQPSNQTYPLTVTLAPPESMSIRPGMAATIFVTYATPSTAPPIIVPGESVVNDKEGKSFVWIYEKKNGSVKKQYVRLGRLMSGGIEVTGGLTHGVSVVTAGAPLLVPGQKVYPLASARNL